MRTIIINFLIAGFLSLSACSVYKVDVRQGNELEAEQVAKLKLGMTQQQVQFLLGSPLLTDPFHHNRWDYVRSFRESGEKTSRQLLTLFFKDGKLVKIDDSQLQNKILNN